MRIALKLLLSFSVVGALPVLIALGIIQYSIRPSYEQIALAAISHPARSKNDFSTVFRDDFLLTGVTAKPIARLRATFMEAESQSACHRRRRSSSGGMGTQNSLEPSRRNGCVAAIRD